VQNDGQPTLTDTCLRPIFIKFWGAAEPLDKNRSRMFQPTLRFLNAIGGKYGNYLRGSYGEGFANSFWRGIGLQRRRGEEKNILGPEKFFRGLGARNKAAQARQAKTSRGQPPRSDDLRWVWLVSS